VDTLTKNQRSRLMAAVRGKDTAPELLVRSTLHRLGYRFRLHGADLPGRPDLVLARHKKVVFVHGCFWHRHSCSRATTPKTRRGFWLDKFLANQRRDARNYHTLKKSGWTVVVIWECEAYDASKLLRRIRSAFARTRSPVPASAARRSGRNRGRR
jgi:DNA mismatch endonuclease, patch repair protein